jgi:hypothetical protein
LRGIVGNPVDADLINLTVCLAEDNEVRLSFVCASCEELNEDMILTIDVVDRLHDAVNRKVMLANVNESNENVYVDSFNGVLNVDREINVVDELPEVADVEAVNGNSSENGKASADLLRQEQILDDTLAGWWSLAKQNKGGFYIKDGLLYHKEKFMGYEIEQLVLPKGRIGAVLKLAHEGFGGHLAMKKTRDRIRISGFMFPSMTSTCKTYTDSCRTCQLRSRVTCYDRVPITAIPRADEPFGHWFMDCFGKVLPNQEIDYNYALVLVDSYSRWPIVVPLRTLTAKNVCDALLQVFAQTGVAMVMTLSSDNGSNFAASLTREFMNRLGCSPRFITPGHPNATGLVERAVGTTKRIIGKLAEEHPRQWQKYLPFVLWALREAPNETTGLPPFTFVYGRLPKGPLAILKETWSGERELPLNLGKSAVEYLEDLREKMTKARDLADVQTKHAQSRYVDRYNLRSKDKSFEVGEKCIILMPDTTASKVFSKWKGPAEIIEVKSPYSYLVEYKGARYHVHANKLKKFHVRVDEVVCDSVSICVKTSDDIVCNTCAIIYEKDDDFGGVDVVEIPPVLEDSRQNELLPSQKIDHMTLSHLSRRQKQELLDLLDRYPECFSDTPGLCALVTHEIPISSDFKPKRLKAYRVPENLKGAVEEQIQELLRLGFIKPSKSPMASPVVCVLKGKDGKDGVRLAINYQYVNKHTTPDVLPMSDISEVIQRVGKARYITCCDAKSGYWQCPVREDHQWLTAFVCDSGLYEFTRCPFGMRSSGCTFVRAIKQVIEPLKDFVESYVDDMAVYSDEWRLHLDHLNKFLSAIRMSGITLNLKKCSFAKSEIKFVGHIIGSGKRRADPDKVATVLSLKIPETKKQLRQVLGFYSFFRDYIPNFSEHAKPLTELTAKRIPNRIPWGEAPQQAFDRLKELLCRATMEPLNIIDMSKPFSISVDASDYAAGGIFTQMEADRTEKPVAFASTKFTSSQRNWSTIEKEAYAAIWALNKFRHWIFGKPVVLYSDHNPITYLTEANPKSAKLMRWALALQEFEVQIRYRAGKNNLAADCVSRLTTERHTVNVE